MSRNYKFSILEPHERIREGEGIFDTSFSGNIPKSDSAHELFHCLQNKHPFVK